LNFVEFGCILLVILTKGGVAVSGRIFQGVIVQMREATDRLIGVLDPEGTVIASTDLSFIGQSSTICISPEEAGNIVTKDGKTYKILEPSGAGIEYIVFAEGEDVHARSLCILAAIAATEAKIRYEENNDRTTFVKRVLSDNVLPGDIYVSSQELGFDSDVLRAAFLIRRSSAQDLTVMSLVREMFPNTQSSFVISFSLSDVALITTLPDGEDTTESLLEIAGSIERRLNEASIEAFVIGVGTPASNLRELADRYKEAQVAIEVGKVFDTEQTIILYETLGIARLIYQLPVRLCEMFLSEIFHKNPIEALDSETLYTINKFFENNLNVSETSRRLFVHRNTLVYRLEKIKKITGLDLRELDHAIVFKVALMVKKYLDSQQDNAIRY